MHSSHPIRVWTNWLFCASVLLAFVALVLPFDSFRGRQAQALQPFFAGWGMLRRLGRTEALTASRPPRDAKQFQYRGRGSEGTRNCEVVQCFEGLWFHSAP